MVDFNSVYVQNVLTTYTYIYSITRGEPESKSFGATAIEIMLSVPTLLVT
jgi:hypothetical protein